MQFSIPVTINDKQKPTSEVSIEAWRRPEPRENVSRLDRNDERSINSWRCCTLPRRRPDPQGEEMQPKTNRDELLTVRQVLDELGGVSRDTFYEWRERRKAPPCIRLPNGHLRVRRGDLLDWLESLRDDDRKRAA